MQLTSLSLALTRAGFLSFSPASLFAAGEPGVWYDPSDFSTMFQDAAGTTPVTAVEQPVGLMLDKSKGLVLGPELVTNGGPGFTATTGWSYTGGAGGGLSVVNGELVVTCASSLTGPADRSGRVTLSGLTIGTRYKLVYSIKKGSAAEARLVFGTSVGGGDGTFVAMSNAGSPSVSGTVYVTATATTHYLEFYAAAAAASQTAILVSASVRELPGNHATQTTSTSRPVLSARYNLLTKTEQFDDAAWTKVNATVTANAVVAPDGTTTADKLVSAASTDQKLIRPASLTTTAGQHILACYLKAGEFSFAGLSLYDGTSYFAAAGFNLSNGTVTSTFGGSASITPQGNGWYLCAVTGTATAAIQAQFSGIRLYSSAPAGVASNCVGDGTSGIYIWGASLVPANQASLPYQRVNTSTDYDTTGFPLYLKFDGVDDWLVTTTITPGIDKAQVFAGVRKLSDAAPGMLVEFSSSVLANNGAFYIAAPEEVSSYSFRLQGTAGARTYTSGFNAPVSSLIQASFDISGATRTDEIALRINGTANVGINGLSGPAGTGNFLAYPLYIGRRGGATVPFNGHLYGLIVRFGSTLPAQAISDTETWLNGKTRAY